jgi:hypothetical protein
MTSNLKKISQPLSALELIICLENKISPKVGAMGQNKFSYFCNF